ncbi:MAG: NADH-quinone oxidoreductase subunit NuoK [Bacteroidia bacterium]
MTSQELLLYLLIGSVIFASGLLTLLLRRNALLLLIGVELMINGVNLNFLAFSRFHNDVNGALFVLFSIAVAAVEAVIGLGLVIAIFRNHENLSTQKLSQLQG